MQTKNNNSNNKKNCKMGDLCRKSLQSEDFAPPSHLCVRWCGFFEYKNTALAFSFFFSLTASPCALDRACVTRLQSAATTFECSCLLFFSLFLFLFLSPPPFAILPSFLPSSLSSAELVIMYAFWCSDGHTRKHAPSSPHSHSCTDSALTLTTRQETGRQPNIPSSAEYGSAALLLQRPICVLVEQYQRTI